MWLSVLNGRSERRSDDGRMILRSTRAGQKPPLDLLFCGAPLRNRTVDLLLTIWTFLGSLPTLRPLGQQQPPPTRPVRELRPVGKPCRLRETTRVSPDPANGRDHGYWHAIQAHSVRLSPARPRPGRRSDDGQTILLPVWHDQKCLAEQALPLTASSLPPAEFEPPPRSAPSGDRCQRQPGVFPGPRSCHGDHSSPATASDLYRCHIPNHQSKIQMHDAGSIRLPSALSITGRSTPKQRERFTDRFLCPSEWPL